MQRIERRGARGEAFAVTGELEARIDAFAPDVGEIVDEEAREITGLLGGAERAEGGRQVFVERGMFGRGGGSDVKARTLGQERASDDAKGQARVAPLQEADRRLHRVDVALGVREKVRDRGRHDARVVPSCFARWRSSSAMRASRGAEKSRRNNAIDVSACEIPIPSAGGVLAQESGQIRRRRVRRIELDHRRGNE